MLSMSLSSACRVGAVISILFTAPLAATTLIASSATLDATLASAVGGDKVLLVGNFGEVRLTNRNYSGVMTIDASQATFTTAMVFDNVRNVAVTGGTFNIGNNGAYAKGVAVYNGANVYIEGITVNGGGTVDQFGVTFNGTHNAQVTFSKFNGLYSGIALGAVSGGFLVKNSFTASTSDGIDIADSHGVTASRNSCTGATPRAGAHPDCIQMWSVVGHALESDISVTYNTSIGAMQGFSDFDAGQNITISNNIVSSSYAAGVACYDCINSTITNNSISTLAGAPYQSQVIVRGGSGNIVTGNIVAAYNQPRLAGSAPTLDGLTAYQGPAFDDAALALPGADTGGGAVVSADATLLSDEGAISFDAGAVPEPSSWGLLITGFAAVGLARRRAVALAHRRVVAAGRTA